MDLQNAKKHIKVTEVVVEDMSEQALDCDLLLPDYLPDIAAVLKCITQPIVQNYQLSGDRIMAEGVVKVQILYLDEERNCVHTFETIQPFGCMFQLKENDNNAFVQLTAKSNYTNCRAISPRRADVHGTFTVKLSVYGEKEKTVMDLVPEKGFQTKCESAPFSRLIGSKAKSFTVNETLELANTIEANTLLKSTAVAHVTECKAIKNKAIVKGDLLIRSVYSLNAETGKLGSAENTIPFSQIIDLEGVQEESCCVCRAAVLHCEAHPAQTPVGENKLLTVSAKINLDFCAFQTEETLLLTDLYHTDCYTKAESSLMEFSCIHDVEKRTETCVTTLDATDRDMDVIEDLWCDVESVSDEKENGICVQTLICMLGRDSKNDILFFERSAEFRLNIPQKTNCMKTNVKILKTEWKRIGTGWELQVTFAVEVYSVVTKSLSVVTSIECDENTDRLKTNGNDGYIKVYFAAPGETVWEIGKKHRISMDSVCRENNVTEDEVMKKDTMIVLVP